ncbi:radical SAM protein [Candidatus Woesearchaeota archaeon]|nr:radical SAM protein [Candidatus Woesearchaeota archaeon]
MSEDSLKESLDIIVISENHNYLDAAEEIIGNQSRKYKLNLNTASKVELLRAFENNGRDKFKSDIILFDLTDRVDSEYQMGLLNRYMSRNQNVFAIASVLPSEHEKLIYNSLWQNMQRDLEGTPLSLTNCYRILEKETNLKNLKIHFGCINMEQLKDNVLECIDKLKRGDITYVHEIAQMPSEFKQFSERVQKETKSRIVLSSISKMRTMDVNKIKGVVENLQPKYHYSVPQHCFPPFEKLDNFNPEQVQESITPLITDVDKLIQSIYIHIPFCLHKCAFCDYTTVEGTLNSSSEYINRLKKEMQMYYDLTEWEVLTPKGIQIGGGTPTMLAADRVKELGEFIHDFYDLNMLSQLTFEASPNTATAKKLDAFRDIGATRVSVGLQSVKDDALLHWIKRWFSPTRMQKTINMLLQRWPCDTNIDIMFGLPNQTLDSWEKDLEAVVDMRIPSVTTYYLRISPRTGFADYKDLPHQEIKILMYTMAREKLMGEGYVQIANNQFVKNPDMQKYIYRDMKKRGGGVLGIGMSSYSIFPGLIYFNIGAKDNRDYKNLHAYMNAVESGRLPIEIGKKLDKHEQKILYMTQGLKLSAPEREYSGVNMADFEKRFEKSIQESFPHTKTLMENGLLEINKGYINLTPSGLAMEDPVLKTFWQGEDV